jgi:hypothetical protein
MSGHRQIYSGGFPPEQPSDDGAEGDVTFSFAVRVVWSHAAAGCFAGLFLFACLCVAAVPAFATGPVVVGAARPAGRLMPPKRRLGLSDPLDEGLVCTGDVLPKVKAGNVCAPAALARAGDVSEMEEKSTAGVACSRSGSERPGKHPCCPKQP